MITVRKCTVAEIEQQDTFWALLSAYADECKLDGLPEPAPKMETYKLIEMSGTFNLFGAFQDDTLVGFVVLMIPVLPHYGVYVAIAESMFVAKPFRSSGAGLALIRAAEKAARAAKSPAILFTAPVGGDFIKVLPGLKYRETNRIFMKDLK